MILTLDVGNTSITSGIYDGESLVRCFRMPSDTDLAEKDYEELLTKNIGTFEIQGAIIGSVVEEINNRLSCAISKCFNVVPVMLSHNSNMPVRLKLKNNSEIGADRISNGVRAYEIFKKSVIVVDFGTATTFDIVNSKGEFVGGLIAPGINTQFNSLHKSTSKLPQLDVEYINNAIGNSTVDAILSGVVRGTACMIDGMLSQCEKELDDMPVIVGTGGLCNLVGKYMERKFDLVSEYLTIEGLRDLYKLNSRA
jgi:type III pantothenate kinase